jgi:UDPglucose 6-dehydrogenase
VKVVDLNAERIAAWNDPDLSQLPVYEPGLAEVEPAIASADMAFIAVNTPTKSRGLGAGQASDLRWIEAGAHRRNREGPSFAVLSNPEFLAEGTAIADLEQPDRVLIGSQWVPPERILRTNLWSSELSKLTALCEATGADVREVGRAIGSDSRIGGKFLQAGPGFGGSCFQKDILNLVVLCRHYGLHEVAAYWQQVVDLNTWQQHRISRLVVNRLFGTVTGKRIAVLGFALKADTNDTRETPAIRICRDLLEEGAQLAIFDPKVSAEQIAADLGVEALMGSGGEGMQGEGVWQPAADPLAAAQGADAVLLLTEWQQFRQLDWPALAAEMRRLHARRGCGCGLWGRVRGEGGGARREGSGAQEHAHRRRLAGKPVKTRRTCAAVQAYCDVIGMGRAGRCQCVGLENRSLVLRVVPERAGSDHVVVAGGGCASSLARARCAWGCALSI